MYKYFFIICIFFSSTGFAQEPDSITPLPGMRGVASNLPDISVVGDIAGKVSNIDTDTDKNKVLVRELEFAFQGYIYPEIRTDIFFALHRHESNIEPELCEGYVNFLKIFDGLGLKAGKLHIDFGKINKIHQHERPYSDQPPIITNFFGEHGLVGEGGSLSYLFPLPFFLQFDLGAWRIPASHHHQDEEPETINIVDVNGSTVTVAVYEEHQHIGFSLADEVYTARFWTSFAVTEISELELGASGATGRGAHYLHHQDEAKVVGIDLTYKLWLSTYQRLIIQNEILFLNRIVPVGELNRYGFYNYLGYQLNKYWDLGIRYDWSENAAPVKETESSFSTITTCRLTETTKLRLQYSYGIESKSSQAFLQLVFGIGPHSHPLQ